MTALLTLRDVSVGRRLKPSSLSLSAGEFVGLIGPNGAGKTTLLRAGLGLMSAKGESSIARLPVSARPRHVAYLAQEREVVWPITVEDIVALGWRANPDHRGEGLAEARALLDRLGLGAFARRHVPDLSGGERARVLLARALAQGAPLLIADEPCAALDPAQSIRTAKLLRARTDAGDAVLATLHDLPLAARYCTRVILLDQGEIRADGPPEAVLTPGLCREVFGITLLRQGGGWAVSELEEET
ncbi:ABC transporter ATP-binding protein [Paracoccus luteus]|uniref:ABC transporter ATP-binding protein n=1 Tax=Paracoccus luteus TaxID=2508543 RepID=UPI00106FDDE6|nr:ABC transporter ATP-binding protein [Paracoccus luteus]